MHKMAKVLPVMLSVLLVSASASVSVCDLSCWLDQRRSECHSASPAAEDGMSASSAMEMSAEMEMEAHSKQGPNTLYASTKSVMRHVMSAQMEMTRREQHVISQTELSGDAALAHSGAASVCNHETCSQAGASSSPSRRNQGRSPDPHRGVIRVSTRANLLTSSNRIAHGAPPLIHPPADLLSPLRI